MDAGQLIHGRYRLESPLGSGGFCDVWRAFDQETGTPVALKLPRPGRETEANARLSEEAALLRALDHPNIVRALDSGRDGAREFLVMELVEGRTLRDSLRDSGPMTDDDVVALGVALAGALQAIHASGMVHGDVKPGNIILASGGPRLIDFGTGRNLDDTMSVEDLQQIAGTLAYIAPELLAGEPLSPQSDLYSLGVTLYEARSGALPAASVGGRLAGADARRVTPLRMLTPGVNPRLESAIMQALAIDPVWRPNSAAAFRERLSSGRHDTLVLRPQRGSASTPGRRRESLAAGAGFEVMREQRPARGVPTYEEWLASRHGQPTAGRRLFAAAVGLALAGLVAFGAVTALTKNPGDGNEVADRAETPESTVVAVSESPAVTPSATSTNTQRPTNTSVPATSTPSPTATPVPPTATRPVPTATPIPPTSTSTSVRQGDTQLNAESAASTVVRWYELVVDGRFESAYALWSDRMKANFPRQGNLDGRWANTVSVSVNSVRVTSQSDNRATVAIDFVETLANGSSNRYVGSWELVASPGGWLMDQPSF